MLLGVAVVVVSKVDRVNRFGCILEVRMDRYR
jgi:hypothetical protein